MRTRRTIWQPSPEISRQNSVFAPGVIFYEFLFFAPLRLCVRFSAVPSRTHEARLVRPVVTCILFIEDV